MPKPLSVWGAGKGFLLRDCPHLLRYGVRMLMQL